MKGSLRILLAGFVTCLSVLCVVCPTAGGSAYNGHPKLVVIVIIDQFRGDYLERYRDQFVEGGFRLLLDKGAYFTDCNYATRIREPHPGTPRC
jgi:predicted AlkP superfamily pyrophosphatase or phosphodiesterase